MPHLFYSDFRNAKLIENSQSYSNVSFSEMLSFHNAKIINGYFEKPIFIDTDFSGADLKGSMINDAHMIGNIDLRCKNHQICD